MKVAIITDTHFGARNDSVIFLDYQARFLSDVFFPFLKNNGITTVLHLGDLVDRRKYVNFHTASRMKEDFILPLFRGRYNVHMILGNHDIFHKNKRDINAFDELLDSYSNDRIIDTFRVYKNPETIVLGDLPVLLLPWIAKDNEIETMKAIDNTSATVCMGHLELNGFVMNLGTVCENGMDASKFDKFDVVLSGHFHQKSQRENILYLGAPWEITWSDFDQPRGFHVLDTETLNIQFIKNPYSLFNKIVYNDAEKTQEELLAFAKDLQIHGTYCKIVVEQKSNPYTFDLFLREVEEHQPFDLKVVEQIIMHEYDEEIITSHDTVSILNKSVDSLEIQVNKKKLKGFINKLYDQAVSVGVE